MTRLISKESAMTQCWIDPNGKTFDVTFMRHEYEAINLLDGIYGIIVEYGHACEQLEKLNWIHVGTNYISGAYNRATDNQLDTIYKIRESTFACGLRQLIDQWFTREG
jgi:hypothetical protein